MRVHSICLVSIAKPSCRLLVRERREKYWELDAVVEMGKFNDQRLPVAQQSHGGSASRTFFLCRRRAVDCYSVKCAAVSVLSLAAFLSALFWLLPLRYRQDGFDAEDSVKLSATVQSYFKLEKPVSELLPYVSRLEYDINDEIGVPSSKVAVLSMHKAELPNRTDVVFGFLPDPINSTLNIVSLSLLKSSLIDLFLQQFNLSLTFGVFGDPSSFEILMFPDGVTIIPEQANLMSQSLLNFTLVSSIYDIKENLLELKDQLRSGLRLKPDEAVYIQVTNKHGSTKDSPVIVEASVASDLGTMLPERLLQLARIITRSPSMDNLGLDHSIFGKVKEISLSSFLNHSLYTPSPAPTPTPSPSPSTAQSYSPAFAPKSHSSPPPGASQPSGSTPHCRPINAPSPSPITHPKKISPNLSPRAALRPQNLPGPSPFPGAPYGSLHVSSSNMYTHSSFMLGTWRIPWLYLNGLSAFLLLLWNIS